MNFWLVRESGGVKGFCGFNDHYQEALERRDISNSNISGYGEITILNISTVEALKQIAEEQCLFDDFHK